MPVEVKLTIASGQGIAETMEEIASLIDLGMWTEPEYGWVMLVLDNLADDYLVDKGEISRFNDSCELEETRRIDDKPAYEILKRHVRAAAEEIMETSRVKDD